MEDTEKKEKKIEDSKDSDRRKRTEFGHWSSRKEHLEEVEEEGRNVHRTKERRRVELRPPDAFRQRLESSELVPEQNERQECKDGKGRKEWQWSIKNKDVNKNEKCKKEKTREWLSVKKVQKWDISENEGKEKPIEL